MIRSLLGWLADLATALICLTADITRQREQRAYEQQCWLDAMRAERSRKWAYDLQRCYNWRCPAMTGIIRGIDRLEGVDNV